VIKVAQSDVIVLMHCHFMTVVGVCLQLTKEIYYILLQHMCKIYNARTMKIAIDR